MYSKAFEHGIKLAYTNQHLGYQLQAHQQHPRLTAHRLNQIPTSVNVNAAWHTPDRAVATSGIGAGTGLLLGAGYGMGRRAGVIRGGALGGLLGAGLAGGGYALANIAGR